MTLSFDLLWLDPNNNLITIHRILNGDWQCRGCKAYIPRGCVVYHQWTDLEVDWDQNPYSVRGTPTKQPPTSYVLLCKGCAINYKYWYRGAIPFNSYYYNTRYATASYGNTRHRSTEYFLKELKCPADSLCQAQHMTESLVNNL
jgi:hypothetical protein